MPFCYHCKTIVSSVFPRTCSEIVRSSIIEFVGEMRSNVASTPLASSRCSSWSGVSHAPQDGLVSIVILQHPHSVPSLLSAPAPIFHTSRLCVDQCHLMQNGLTFQSASSTGTQRADTLFLQHPQVGCFCHPCRLDGSLRLKGPTSEHPTRLAGGV